MRTLLISLFILLISSSAYSQDYFPNSDIKDLLVYRVNTDQNTAWIRDNAGNEAVVTLQDRIGAEQAVVVTIDKNSITVQSGKTKTRMPVIAGRVFSQDAKSDKSLLPFHPE